MEKVSFPPLAFPKYRVRLVFYHRSLGGEQTRRKEGNNNKGLRREHKRSARASGGAARDVGIKQGGRGIFRTGKKRGGGTAAAVALKKKGVKGKVRCVALGKKFWRWRLCAWKISN
jgi:hypothetical protein